MNQIKCFCNNVIYSNNHYNYCNYCKILSTSVGNKSVVMYFYDDMTVTIANGIARVDWSSLKENKAFNINPGPKEEVYNKIKTYMLFI